MSIASEIQRIKDNIEDAYTECESKGATLPQDQNSDNLADTIASISGGGGDLSEYFNTEYTYNPNVTRQLIKKIPPLTKVGGSYTQFNYAFQYWPFEKLVLPIMDATGVKDFMYTFDHVSPLQNVYVDELDLSKIQNANSIETAYNMFSNAKILSIKNISALDFTHARNLNSMFQSFDNQKKPLDLSGLVTSNTLTGCTNIFYSCTATSINASGLNTSSVSNLSGVFGSCSNATQITHNLNTSSCTDLSSMFTGDKKLESINVSNFNTSLVTDFSSMFNNCELLTNLDLSNFTTPSITKASTMFGNCKKLAVLDISKCTFSTLTRNFGSMFYNCGQNCLQSDGAYADGITKVYVKDATEQNWVLTANNGHPNTWTTDNVVIKQN